MTQLRLRLLRRIQRHQPQRVQLTIRIQALPLTQLPVVVMVVLLVVPLLQQRVVRTLPHVKMTSRQLPKRPSLRRRRRLLQNQRQVTVWPSKATNEWFVECWIRCVILIVRDV